MDENTEILKEILKEQKRLNDLLVKNLTRIKYRLWTLLLLLTFTSIVLGVYAYRNQSSRQPAGFPAIGQPVPNSMLSPRPQPSTQREGVTRFGGPSMQREGFGRYGGKINKN
jgi:hypothetical protein